jgi:hypothetical protein
VVDVDILVGGEAGQQHWVARQPALDPTAHRPSQARQQRMWPLQALRVATAALRDEVGPLQAGLHAGVMRLNPLRSPQPFMVVPYVKIGGLLPIAPHALFDNGQGAIPRTRPPRAAVEQTAIVLALSAWCPAAPRARWTPQDRAHILTTPDDGRD